MLLSYASSCCCSNMHPICWSQTFVSIVYLPSLRIIAGAGRETNFSRTSVKAKYLSSVGVSKSTLYQRTVLNKWSGNQSVVWRTNLLNLRAFPLSMLIQLLYGVLVPPIILARRLPLQLNTKNGNLMRVIWCQKQFMILLSTLGPWSRNISSPIRLGSWKSGAVWYAMHLLYMVQSIRLHKHVRHNVSYEY